MIKLFTLFLFLVISTPKIIITEPADTTLTDNEIKHFDTNFGTIPYGGKSQSYNLVYIPG